MKNILIIYPHWPPSNLAGVHRARLIANYLSEFEWHPVVLSVHPDCYEEPHDWDLLKTVSDKIEVHFVKAFKVRKPRIIGDIGLRSFFQLKQAALEIIKQKKIEFIWIPIPSFYIAILGRVLFNKTKIPYGIDYIDPWVRDISNRKNLRAILSNAIARLLEPYAIKKASLVSGVAEAYFKPAIERNFRKMKPVQVAMPYGFDRNDHLIRIENIFYPWSEYKACKPYIYAGAFLPLSGLFINLLCKALRDLKNLEILDPDVRLFFIGTGNYNHKSIAEYAEEYGVNDIVIEIRDRFPFLHVLNFLSGAKGVLLIGSTEEHYTASKTFQSVLSGRPVFSILHYKSTAVEIFKKCKADAYLCEYEPDQGIEIFYENIKIIFSDFLDEKKVYEPDFNILENYSAKQSANSLIKAINSINYKK